MSNITEINFLKLLSEGSKILPDVTFKFEDSEKTLVVHKQVLALMSTVFEEQFYGPMSAHARADGYLSSEMEYIEEKDFHYETFYIFIRHLYGDKDILNNCSSYSTLFQLLNMAKLYLIDKLGELVHQRIQNLEMSMEILLASLETVLAYRNLEGFKEICEKVTKEIVSTFSTLPNADQFRFYKDQRHDNPELVASLIDIMSAKNLAANAEPIEYTFDLRRFFQFYQENKEGQPEKVNALVDLMSDFVQNESEGQRNNRKVKHVEMCTNCVTPVEYCKDGQLVDVVPHPGLRYLYDGEKYQVETVIRSGYSADGNQDYRIKEAIVEESGNLGRCFNSSYSTTFKGWSKYACK